MGKPSSTQAPSLAGALARLYEFQATRPATLGLLKLCVSLALLCHGEDQTPPSEPLTGTAKSRGQKNHDKVRPTCRNGCRERDCGRGGGICRGGRERSK